jgi:hypothetical protein
MLMYQLHARSNVTVIGGIGVMTAILAVIGQVTPRVMAAPMRNKAPTRSTDEVTIGMP